jgi:hypothetical protein
MFRVKTPTPGRAAAALLAVALVSAGSAHGDHLLGNIPWTTLLPPRPGVPPPAEPAIPCGEQPTPQCVDQVIADMVAGWEPLDADCDARAVFALTYLLTTEAFRATLGTGFFDDESAIINLDRVFANLYFSAYEGYASGTAPPAWTIAFDKATGLQTNAVQDVFLGMNAHINRDLPVALAAVGLVRADGSSRKPDHDAVNEILSDVLDHIQDELARLYDPMFSLSDASPSPIDEMGSLEVLKSWREGAWRNAERLALARSDAERDAVMAQIEAYSTAWARIISAMDFSWYAPRRFAYCTAAHAAPGP